MTNKVATVDPQPLEHQAATDSPLEEGVVLVDPDSGTPYKLDSIGETSTEYTNLETGETNEADNNPFSGFIIVHGEALSDPDAVVRDYMQHHLDLSTDQHNRDISYGWGGSIAGLEYAFRASCLKDDLEDA